MGWAIDFFKPVSVAALPETKVKNEVSKTAKESNNRDYFRSKAAKEPQKKEKLSFFLLFE